MTCQLRRGSLSSTSVHASRQTRGRRSSATAGLGSAAGDGASAGDAQLPQRPPLGDRKSTYGSSSSSIAIPDAESQDSAEGGATARLRAEVQAMRAQHNELLHTLGVGLSELNKALENAQDSNDRGRCRAIVQQLADAVRADSKAAARSPGIPVPE